VVDECGALNRFSGSATLTVPHDDGKLRPEALAPYREWLGVEHHVQPAAVTISQVTEMGTVYVGDEIGALAEAAHAAGMVLHVDGARLANAVAATGASVATMLRDTGVDAVTFGFTKNGAMFGEAIVFLRPELAAPARFVRKQAGQLVSKSRFAAAQMTALLEDDLWLRNAAHANEMARRLHARTQGIAGVEFTGSGAAGPAANSLFPRLPAHRGSALSEWSFFWPWDPTDRVWRWMTSFATTDDDVERFAIGVEALLAP
jgi:threonine aldolase